MTVMTAQLDLERANWTALRAPSRELIARGPSAEPIVDGIVERLVARIRDLEETTSHQAARIEQLEALSVTDELTGLLNRRGFNQVLERTIDNAKRYGETGLLAYIDLNGFKTINDSFGHTVGDQVLIEVARTLKSWVRKTDYISRLGGDEFAIVFTRADVEKTTVRATELRERLNRASVTHDAVVIPVRASLGFMAYGPNSELAELIARADEAMYAEKRKSRATA